MDDDTDFCQLLEFNLERLGFTTFIASNGVEALNIARSQLPDVVLLDLMLPDLDGLSVCEILHSQPSTRDIPVFIVSALQESWAGTRKSRARFTGYFTKPVNLKSLGETVRAASKKHQAMMLSKLGDREL